MILLSNSRDKILVAQKYVDDISQADDLPMGEIEKNRERNSDLVVDSLWTVEELFVFFTHKLNCSPVVTRAGFSMDRDIKKHQLFSEHYKE